MTFIVTSGGRDYDVHTTRDANAYLKDIVTATWDLQQVTAPNFQSCNRTANPQRQRGSKCHGGIGELTPTLQRAALTACVRCCSPAYNLILSLAEFADVQVFAAIPATEHAKLVQHACEVFGGLSTCRKWTMTGLLNGHDEELLVVILNCYQHAGFYQASVEGNQLGTLAAFSESCGSRSRVMPSPDAAVLLRNIVLNYRSFLVITDDTPNEEIYGQLEASGMLAQYLRLVTVPAQVAPVAAGERAESDTTGILTVCHEIYQCKSLLKSKLKNTTPTGNVLNAVIAGEDGYQGTINANVANILRTLQGIAEGGCYKCGKDWRDARRLFLWWLQRYVHVFQRTIPSRCGSNAPSRPLITPLLLTETSNA
jgi:hypothetical protein